MTTHYTISIHGRLYRFATLAKAKQAASDIFTRTGVIVGVEQI